MNQTTIQVNPITIKELRLSFLHFLPTMSLMRTRKPSAIPCSFLNSGVGFQNEYSNAVAGGTTLLPPWHDGYGKLFWSRYLPLRTPYDMWRALVPLEYDLSPHVATLAL